MEEEILAKQNQQDLVGGGSRRLKSARDPTWIGTVRCPPRKDAEEEMQFLGRMTHPVFDM